MHTHRNAVTCQHLHGFCQPCAAFHLDHLRAGLHHGFRALQGIIQGGIAHKWQVSHDKGMLVTTAYRSRMIGHICNRDRQSRITPLN